MLTSDRDSLRTARAVTGGAAGTGYGSAGDGPDGVDTAVHWILRIGASACFIGHGAFGIITKAAWVPYFGVWGIPEPWAWRLMPVVGTVDIAIGVLTLFQPIRAVLLYMVFWGFQTACLRPLAGEPIWEFLERTGNFGVPLALLILLGSGASWRDWLTAPPPPPLTPGRAAAGQGVLRATTAMLLIGHGGFGFAMQKREWLGYLHALGIDGPSVAVDSIVPVVGWLECALGLLVLALPRPEVALLAFIWKVGTELLRPAAGEPIWEFVERGGSYAAPLGLFVLRGGLPAIWPGQRRGPGSPSATMADVLR